MLVTGYQLWKKVRNSVCSKTFFFKKMQWQQKCLFQFILEQALTKM